MIDWSEDFATQIEMVDTQHKKLFELLNYLSESYNKNGPSEKLVDDALKRLVAYADKHFVEEEELMVLSKVDPRHVKVHRMEHKSFMYDVTNMLSYSSTHEDLLALIEKLVCFITSWLTYHILATDRIMAAQIDAIQHGASPEKAYELSNTIKYNAAVTRLMLNSVLDLWRASAERCCKLEEKLAALPDNRN
jgi:hemerythrin-like metal-binding protein